jgi:hypothetical protein
MIDNQLSVGLYMDEEGDIGELSFELPADFKHTSLTSLIKLEEELEEQWKQIQELDALAALFS